MSPLTLALQEAAPAAAAWWGTREWVFLSLWAVFTLLYWLNYRKSENPAAAALKVAGLLGFVYAVMWFFDWAAHPVPAAEAITFGLPFPAIKGTSAARIPLLADALFWFVLLLLVMVAWYARRKVGTVGALILSTWDRGHWYMLPVIFIMLTIGLLLVAAAASPVLSPFIYTLF
ncbi:MAG: hypothetical protein FJ296_01025 [Planctomycetes bacterium]|nr:hypothetical protein [Planctomycetota bacterium]